ncbi:MAG TPA: hypothetical protein VG248_04510 [Caulobacteraceae bacterium]|jgi:hypothetical protein|nr:hypothetical protein [Caulobacteraceae bacterium]
MSRGFKLAVGLLLALGVPGPAAQARDGGGCDVKLNVTDQDPAGLNVRAAPGGAVIARLKAKGQWVETHVIGQAGTWARIDKATLIPDDQDHIRDVFAGAGYVAFSKLGFETLSPNSEILAAPRIGARRLLKLANTDDLGMQKTEVLGCSGGFIQIRVKGIVGWTRGFCSNQLTTCV